MLTRSWSNGSYSADAGKLITDAMESVVQQIVELCVESCNSKGGAYEGYRARFTRVQDQD